MADIHVWLQLENKPWDLCPRNVDRLTGKNILDRTTIPTRLGVTLTSPETGVSRTVDMFYPVGGAVPEDALIIRRYTQNWAAPDDRKVNPWDLNEPNPTDSGTMGTIPGATLECNLNTSDRFIVHFRNKDARTDKDRLHRTHSLHPHGVVFAPKYDGAYPLSPPDNSQPITPAVILPPSQVDERALWDVIGVTGPFKQGDRVPPGGTFTYIWETFGWPTTAGVWHYHDHSICDDENIRLGAVGFLVVHNTDDNDDVINQDLPNGQPNGSLFDRRCIGFPFPVPVFEKDLIAVKKLDPHHLEGLSATDAEKFEGVIEAVNTAMKAAAGGKAKRHAFKELMLLDKGDFILEIDPDSLLLRFWCFRVYKTPPRKAQYLQYYHELKGGGMTINGRKYLGNTPTLIGGTGTKMRFGVVGMNNTDFHTFHLHGHRWVIPGPDGTNPTDIENSAQVRAVSQFEDTRTFGPANSFSFTINQGSFMGSFRGSAAPGVGEWHMHCHVLHHMMMDGMMGSLLILNGGEFVNTLPVGAECATEKVENPPGEVTIMVMNNFFDPASIIVPAGTTVNFNFMEGFHTVMTTGTTNTAASIAVNNGAGNGDAVLPTPQVKSVVVTGDGTISYQCGIHGAGMSGTITVSP